MTIVNPIHGTSKYFAKNTTGLSLGILKLGAINLKSTWSINNTPAIEPKNAFAYLFAVCNVITWANY